MAKGEIKNRFITILDNHIIDLLAGIESLLKYILKI